MPHTDTEHDVAALAALPEGTPVHATAGDVELVLVRRGDAVHALDHACPHLGLPLSKGVVEGGVLMCAFHHACFRLDGTQVQPPGHGGLRAYPVAIRAGRVIVDVSPLPRPEPTRGGADRRVVIAGSGAAADEAVLELRARGFDGPVTMVSPEAAPYDRTMLSKAALTGATPFDALTLTSADRLAAHGVDLVRGRLVAVEPGRARLDDGGSLAFDALLVAPGGAPRRLGVPGEALEGVHVLRSRADAEALARDARGSRRAVVVGGGFIGLEGAMSLSKRGLSVTLLTRDALPLGGVVGEPVAQAILREVEAAGVSVVVGEAARLEGGARVARVVHGEGALDADLVLVAVGVAPVTGSIEGLPVERDGGVAVAPDLSVPGLEGVHVAGDCAHAPTPFGRARIEHWRVARQHGRRFAAAVAGGTEAAGGAEAADVPFFWTALGRQYRYVGHAEGWDDLRLDGDPSGPFVARYVRDGRVAAAFGAGRDADLARLHLAMARAGGPVPA